MYVFVLRHFYLGILFRYIDKEFYTVLHYYFLIYKSVPKLSHILSIMNILTNLNSIFFKQWSYGIIIMRHNYNTQLVSI